MNAGKKNGAGMAKKYGVNVNDPDAGVSADERVSVAGLKRATREQELQKFRRIKDVFHAVRTAEAISVFAPEFLNADVRATKKAWSEKVAGWQEKTQRDGFAFCTPDGKGVKVNDKAKGKRERKKRIYPISATTLSKLGWKVLRSFRQTSTRLVIRKKKCSLCLR